MLSIFSPTYTHLFCIHKGLILLGIIWQILIQFIFRLTFGVAFSMGITPSRWVTSGFYRVHLWVLMGTNTFGSLVLFTHRNVLPNGILVFSISVAIAATSYVGAVCWLYEKKKAGVAILYGVAAGSAVAAICALPMWQDEVTTLTRFLVMLDMATAGLLLGVTITAMFLGHWYLNNPGMPLEPLKRLVLIMGLATIARIAVCGTGLGLEVAAAATVEKQFWIFVVFRWLSGLLGALVMAKLTWETLKVPNTQSATGILYAGVILTFLGELTSQLMSLETEFPV